MNQAHLYVQTWTNIVISAKLWFFYNFLEIGKNVHFFWTPYVAHHYNYYYYLLLLLPVSKIKVLSLRDEKCCWYRGQWDSRSHCSKYTITTYTVRRVSSGPDAHSHISGIPHVADQRDGHCRNSSDHTYTSIHAFAVTWLIPSTRNTIRH